MWLALLRNVLPGARESRVGRGRRKSVRRKLNVELLEDRQLLASSFVTWAEGPVSPGDSLTPAAPIVGDVIRFTLDGPTFSNSCVAAVHFGGYPVLLIDEAARTINVGFQGPVGDVCPAVYAPVSGFYGQLTDLSVGAWVLSGPLSSIPFTVQAAQPIELPFVTIDQGEVSGYRFDDPHFKGEDLVIQDQTTWQAFWAQHASLPAPEVDFQSRIVIATLLGPQSTGGGPRIDVEAVFLSPDGALTVFVKDNRLPGITDQITSPFHIVSIPRVVFAAPVFVHREVQAFQTIDRGPISYFRYDDPTFTGLDAVIQDRDTWQTFWGQHTSGLFPPPPLPEIDFDRQMVIVTLLGYQTTGGGPSTTITDVLYNPVDGTLTVRTLDNCQPGPLDVITNPYHFVVVDRVAFSSVEFQHRTV